MISTTGTYQHGTVILDQPVNLPEGAHLRVTLDSPDAPPGDDEDRLGDGRPWPKTPEEIEAYLAEMDAIPSLEMSDEEFAQWEARRKKEREWQKAQFPKWVKDAARAFP